MTAAIDAPVRVLFFEQSIGCETCAPTRRLLESLHELNPLIAIEPYNLVLDAAVAAQHGVDRAPGLVISASGRDRIRFFGSPLGYELSSLAQALQMTASGEAGLSDSTRAQLAALAHPVRIQVFFTPTCVYCPQMVTLAARFAIASPHISVTAIDAIEYPDLVRRYTINGVPKTILNDETAIVGAATEEELLAAVLQSAVPPTP